MSESGNLPTSPQDWLWGIHEAQTTLGQHVTLPHMWMKSSDGTRFKAKDVTIFRLDSLEGES